MRLLKILVVLVVLAFLALTGYAYLGDMAPRQQEMRQPVTLDTGRAAPAAAPAAAAPAAPAPAPADTPDTTPTEGAEDADPNGLD